MLRALAFADTMWGGLSRALNTNQMKAAAAGAWEQGAAPGACGWVTLYNYNTAVKAPAPEWRWAGGMPASHLLSLFSALNGLVLFGLELTVVCVFHPPSRLFSLSGPSACSRSSEGPLVGGRIVKWPLSEQERE